MLTITHHKSNHKETYQPSQNHKGTYQPCVHNIPQHSVNVPDQSDASLVTPTTSTQLMLQNSDDAQIHPNLPAPTTHSLDKHAQITLLQKKVQNQEWYPR